MRNIRAKVLFSINIIFALSFQNALGYFVGPGIQIIQSIPLETNLGQPDLPFTQPTWIEMIRKSKTSILLGQFYFSSKDGESLEPVISELEQAGKRNVKIRMLVSNKLLQVDKKTYERMKRISGSEIQILDLDQLTGGILHAKYWVIDSKIVFVGSQNFDWKALKHIHETGAMIEDIGIASQLSKIFEMDWEIAASGKPPILGAPAECTTIKPTAKTHLEVELVASPPQLNPPCIRSALSALLELIHEAKTRISIQLLNYSLGNDPTNLWKEIDDALRLAAKRGIKVELLVSDWNTEKPGIDHLKSLNQVPNITVKIATIPPFSGGFISFARVIHSKIMVVDNQVFWLGTSNWSKGYFDASRNVELIFRQRELVMIGVRIFDTIWNSHFVEEVDLNKQYVPPIRE